MTMQLKLSPQPRAPWARCPDCHEVILYEVDWPHHKRYCSSYQQTIQQIRSALSNAIKIDFLGVEGMGIE